MSGTEPGLGDIGCTTINGSAGRLIQIAQWLNGDGWSHVEHCFTYVGDGQIIEAEPGGARLAPLSEYDAREIVWVRCPEQCRQGVAEAARSFIGTGYSAADYLAQALHRLHIPAPGLRRFIQSSGHMVCSQMADRAAELGGWRLFDDGRWCGYVDPAEIAALAEPPA